MFLNLDIFIYLEKIIWELVISLITKVLNKYESQNSIRIHTL